LERGRLPIFGRVEAEIGGIAIFGIENGRFVERFWIDAFGFLSQPSALVGCQLNGSAGLLNLLFEPHRFLLQPCDLALLNLFRLSQ
jgi:hypothetical protein